MESATEIVEYTIFELEDNKHYFDKRKRFKKGFKASNVKVVDLSNGEVVPSKHPTVHKYKSREGYTVEEPDTD